MHAQAARPPRLSIKPATGASLPARRQIARDYASLRPLVIGTLRGAVIFMADLVREMDPVPDGLELDFVRASSYGSGTTTSGVVNLVSSGSSLDVAGRHVLLVSHPSGLWLLAGGPPLLHCFIMATHACDLAKQWRANSASVAYSDRRGACMGALPPRTLAASGRQPVSELIPTGAWRRSHAVNLLKNGAYSTHTPYPHAHRAPPACGRRWPAAS
jgi:hypothetical protein